jgi:hypothetical protein
MELAKTFQLRQILFHDSCAWTACIDTRKVSPRITDIDLFLATGTVRPSTVFLPQAIAGHACNIQQFYWSLFWAETAFSMKPI